MEILRHQINTNSTNFESLDLRVQETCLTCKWCTHTQDPYFEMNKCELLDSYVTNYNVCNAHEKRSEVILSDEEINDIIERLNID